MASDKAIDALSKDPERAQRTARTLQGLADAGWTAWEQTFLGNLADLVGDRPLSYRQAEKLLDLVDRATVLTTIDGLGIRHLIRECWQLRLSLEPEDETWVDGLYRSGTTSLRRAAAFRLMACLRAADPDLVDGYGRAA